MAASKNDDQSNANSFHIDGLSALQNYLADFSKELDDPPSSSDTAPAVNASSTAFDDVSIPVTRYQSSEEHYQGDCQSETMTISQSDSVVNQFSHYLGSSNAKSDETILNSNGNQLVIVRRDEDLNESNVVSTSSYVNQDVGVSDETLNQSQNKTTNVLSLNQPIILTMGGNVVQGQQAGQQQILIPLMSNSGLGSLSTGGNTILLPINSLISNDGVFELRLATTGTLQTVQNSQQNSQPILFLINNGTSSSNSCMPTFITMDNNLIINQNDADVPSTSTQAKSPSKTTTKFDKNSMILLQENVDETQNIYLTVNDRTDIDENHRKNVVEPTSTTTNEQNVKGNAMTSLQTKMPKGENFHCQFCDYTNAKRYLMLRHMKSHSEDRPHKCPVCERRFKTPNSLQNHINTHTGVRPHQCKMCEACFTTSGEMIRHVRYKHTLEKPHKCPDCDYASVELSKLKRHMRSHSGERPYQCPNCVYASPDTYKLKRHMRVHTGEKPYECDVCLQRFTQSNSLKAHKLIHAGTKPVFQCEFCPSSCGRKTDLKIHVQKLHGPTELSCKKCTLTFTDRYSFKVHMKSHDGERFQCEICDYTSSSQRHLDAHIQLHNGDKPGVTCKECDLVFVNSHCLTRHFNSNHNPDYVAPEPKEKLFPCGQCPKRFHLKASLIKHVGKHEKRTNENVSLHSAFQPPSSDIGNFQKSLEIEANTDDDEECDDESLWLAMNDDGSRAREILITVPGSVSKSKRRSATTTTSAANKKRKTKRRIKPEQLGLTNLKRRGRPANPPKTPSESAEENELNSSKTFRTSMTIENDDELAKDVENLFGFATASSSFCDGQQQTSTAERRCSNFDDDSIETTLMDADDFATDASMEPLVITDGLSLLNNVDDDDDDDDDLQQNTVEDVSSTTSMFDLTSEERLEIVRYAKKTNS